MDPMDIPHGEALPRRHDSTRRAFIRRGALGVAGLAAGCLSSPSDGAQAPGDTRLRARPRLDVTNTLAPGTHALGPEIGYSATLFVPTRPAPDSPARLFVMLHGAGQSRNFLDAIFPEAEPHGLLVLLPQSRGRTWDLFLGGFGPDVAALDSALEWVFARCPIDPAGVTFGGFSDGGSYALSLGLGNGDLFPRIAAFSPGYLGPPDRIGTPSIFITHGTEDEILPIATTSRPIVEQLRVWEYEVEYREFDGGHVVRLTDVRDVLGWAAGGEVAG